MEEELKEGDVVQLKSGGQIMTIEGITTEGVSQPIAICVWFDKTTLKRERFFLPALQSFEAGDILY